MGRGRDGGKNNNAPQTTSSTEAAKIIASLQHTHMSWIDAFYSSGGARPGRCCQQGECARLEGPRARGGARVRAEGSRAGMHIYTRSHALSRSLLRSVHLISNGRQFVELATKFCRRGGSERKGGSRGQSWVQIQSWLTERPGSEGGGGTGGTHSRRSSAATHGPKRGVCFQPLVRPEAGRAAGAGASGAAAPAPAPLPLPPLPPLPSARASPSATLDA